MTGSAIQKHSNPGTMFNCRFLRISLNGLELMENIEICNYKFTFMDCTATEQRYKSFVSVCMSVFYHSQCRVCKVPG